MPSYSTFFLINRKWNEGRCTHWEALPKQNITKLHIECKVKHKWCEMHNSNGGRKYPMYNFFSEYPSWLWYSCTQNTLKIILKALVSQNEWGIQLAQEPAYELEGAHAKGFKD